jgi:hypothetical protein
VQILDASRPKAPLQQQSEDPPMSAHTLREPWDTPTLGRGGFLKTGSVVPATVPWSAPVLTFAEDGTASGLLSQQLDDDIRAELDALNITFTLKPWPGPHSGACAFVWPAEMVGSFICTLPKGHSADVLHEAAGMKGAVIASPTEALHTESIKPARRTARKPAPKQVA